MNPVPVIEAITSSALILGMGIWVFWWVDGEWVLRHIARRCEIHDRPAPHTIRQLEVELGVERSPSNGDAVTAYINPRLVDCGHSWCRARFRG